MLTLDSAASLPLYQQLYDQLRGLIMSGKLPADSRLPSVRELVLELSVSRNTVEGAYQELYAEGYIYSKPRSGYFVSPLDQEAVPLALTRKPRSVAAPTITQPDYRYDFHPARLDPLSFSRELWRKCFVDSLRENPAELVQYGDPQGELKLRRGIRQYLERSRGVVCEPEQIVVCAGLQQSLDLVAHLVGGSHSVLALENPGYFLPRSVFLNHGFEVLPVPVGVSGLDLDRLRATSATLAYVTPSHQLPLGCVMPVANRLKLIDWAQSGGRFIIEDDYDSELRYHGKPIPSLQGLCPDGNIIYAGTFSKVLSPALRLSYLVLPQSLLKAYRRQFRDYFCTVSLLEQRTLARFIALGHWERHVRRMRTVYKKKHDLLVRALDRQLGARVQLSGQGAGLHLVAELTLPAPGEAQLVERARLKGIRLLPFSDFYHAGRPERTTLLLGFGGMAAKEIEPAVELLARICGGED